MGRVVFLGTPEAAVPSLRGIAEHHEIAAVITQPDRPRGRSGRPAPPPVKTTALELGIPVSQPIDRCQLQRVVEDTGVFDLGVVVAFGRILRREVLDAPAKGMLNLHFSLLPRWRGAAPVQRSLMAGDSMTGVTIIKLDEGLDTGPVLTAQAIDIMPDENSGDLTERLALIGARLLVNTIDDYLTGAIEPVEQSDEGVTHADKITSIDRPIDPCHDVASVLARVRALAPHPGATLEILGTPHKVLSAASHIARPAQGTWLVVDGMPVLGVSDGGVALLSIQPPGRTVMEGTAWARGLHETSGVVG